MDNPCLPIRYIFSLLICFLLTGDLATRAQGINTHETEEVPHFFTGDWEQALEISATIQKPIFVFAYTSFSQTQCNKVLQKIFESNISARQFFNDNFINIKLNLQTETGIKFWKDHELRKFPSYLFFDLYGEFVCKSQGDKSGTEMVKLGQEALKKIALSDESNLISQIYTGFLDLKVQYQNGIRHPNFLYQYAYELKKFNDDYRPVVKEYLEKLEPSNLYQSKNIQFIYDFADDVDSKAFSMLLDQQDIYGSYLGMDRVKHKLHSAIHSYILTNAPANDMVTLKKALQLLDKVALPNVAFAKFYLKLVYFEKATNWLSYAQTANDFLSQGRQLNPNLMWTIVNNFALYVTDKKQLERASMWLKNSPILVQQPELVNAVIAKAGKKSHSPKRKND